LRSLDPNRKNFNNTGNYTAQQTALQRPELILGKFRTMRSSGGLSAIDSIGQAGDFDCGKIFAARQGPQMPPAARISDMHTCPMVTALVPHVGGPIIPACCPTVIISGMPAARVGDMCICVGPTDVIAKGSATVLIGGSPAARIGDMTAHGGVIVSGAPMVIIGG
jgi:uncharacterized Zn-binding protein involved in type VI secretion